MGGIFAPFEIRHTTSDIKLLIGLIHSIEGESRIVMEYIERCYEVIACQLSKTNFFVSTIIHRLIKGFDNDSLCMVELDKADVVKISNNII